jgi:hypothetical protein
MVRGCRSLWGATTKGLSFMFNLLRINLVSSNTQWPLRIMSTYSCRGKSTWWCANWWDPCGITFLCWCRVQGADFVVTGAPDTRSLLSSWADRCGRLPTLGCKSSPGACISTQSPPNSRMDPMCPLPYRPICPTCPSHSVDRGLVPLC